MNTFKLKTRKNKKRKNQEKTELDEDNTNVIKLEFTDKIDGYNTRNIGIFYLLTVPTNSQRATPFSCFCPKYPLIVSDRLIRLSYLNQKVSYLSDNSALA